MKEDLLLRRSKIKDEITKDDYELLIRIQPYSFNDIKREIMMQPEIQEIKTPGLKKRLQNYDGNGNESSQSEHEAKGPQLGVIQENNSRQSKGSDLAQEEEKNESQSKDQNKMDSIVEEEGKDEDNDNESEKQPNEEGRVAS